MNPKTEPEVDTRLLRGAAFRCRPDCGLCCFAAPSVDPEDRAPLLRLRPAVPIEPEGGGFGRIPQRGEGGGCHLLEGLRCRGHGARPLPCRLFPIHAYLGARVQLSVVLSCPGLDLARWSGTRATSSPEVEGLDEELRAFATRWAAVGSRARAERARLECDRLNRRASHRIGHVEREEARARARGTARWSSPPDAPAPPGPSEADGLDRLPMYWDGPNGVVAISDTGGAFELLALSPRGGVRERLGRFGREVGPPAVASDGRAVLSSYLDYLLERDAFVDASLLDWVDRREEEPFDLSLQRDLAEAGATVLARGALRARTRGWAGAALTAGDVRAGIAATDADLLDRRVPGTLL